MNDYFSEFKILFILLISLPLEGFCTQFSILVPVNHVETHVGVLEVSLVNSQIGFDFSPSNFFGAPPNEGMYLCPFYNHIAAGSSPSIKVNLLFDPSSLFTCSYTAHYRWGRFGEYLLQTSLTSCGARLQSCVFFLNKKEASNVACHPSINLWALVNDVIQNQATNIDEYAERSVSDIVLLHNSDPRVSEHFKVASIYPESLKEIVINFHPNERSNVYSVKILIDPSRGGDGINKIVSMKIIRNDQVKITVIQNTQCTGHSNKKPKPQHTDYWGPPPMPPGGGAGSTSFGFQIRKQEGLFEMMEQ